MSDASLELRPMRFDGDRRWALALEMPVAESDGDFVASARAAMADAEKKGAALVYGLVPVRARDAVMGALGWTSVGPAPALVRPLRLGALGALTGVLPERARAFVPKVPLVAPFGGARQAAVREISTRDPRVTRLWDRFSIDIPVAIERNANFLGPRIFDREGYRVFVFEDGDRYVIRALCIFRSETSDGRTRGHIAELLHDRSVAGMRAASHLLGLAIRELSDAGADAVEAWSLVHSGSFPLFARHAFVPTQRGSRALEIGVRAFDPALHEVIVQRHHWYLSEIDSDRF